MVPVRAVRGPGGERNPSAVEGCSQPGAEPLTFVGEEAEVIGLELLFDRRPHALGGSDIDEGLDPGSDIVVGPPRELPHQAQKMVLAALQRKRFEQGAPPC